VKTVELIIKLISKVNHRFYMKLYLIHLKKLGMDIQGAPVYIGSTTSFDGTDYSIFVIKDGAVISSEVRLLTHDFSISRAALSSGYIFENEVPLVKGIEIGENCFVGTRSIIMPGTVLGKGVIVGAGSVVRGKIPDYSIVIGNPANIIGDSREWFNKKITKDPALLKYYYSVK